MDTRNVFADSNFTPGTLVRVVPGAYLKTMDLLLSSTWGHAKERDVGIVLQSPSEDHYTLLIVDRVVRVSVPYVRSFAKVPV